MTANTLDTLAVATGLLGEPLEPVGQPLPASARNRVVRARRPDGSTLVVKHYLDSTHDGRWRELCALKALHGADAAVPAVIAANDHLVVMEDLGDRPHLAAAMLADDPADAWYWLSANWLLDRLIGDQYGQRPTVRRRGHRTASPGRSTGLRTPSFCPRSPVPQRLCSPAWRRGTTSNRYR